MNQVFNSACDFVRDKNPDLLKFMTKNVGYETDFHFFPNACGIDSSLLTVLKTEIRSRLFVIVQTALRVPVKCTLTIEYESSDHYLSVWLILWQY